MATKTVYVKNLDSLVLKLDGMPAKFKKNFLNTAGLMVETTAKEILTDEKKVHTNQLRASIEHEVVDDVCAIGTNLEYAPYVHQGTGKHAANKDGRKTG